jgi:hypothetical protein
LVDFDPNPIASIPLAEALGKQGIGSTPEAGKEIARLFRFRQAR